MKDHDKNDMYEEDPIEVSNLPTGQAFSPRKGLLARIPSSLFLLLSWTRQHRRISALGTISFVVIALVLFVSSILPLHQLQARKGLEPSPAPTPLAGSDLFYFNPLPSWGTVLLDGQPLSHAPVSITSNDPPVRLPQGRHVLEWKADPFVTQRCLLLVPPQSEQTCNVTEAPATPFADYASLITIPVSLAQIRQQERTALIAATQSLLDTLHSSETVQPGEPYTVGSSPPVLQRATAPLRATLRFHLDTDPQAPAQCSGVSLGRGCSIAGQDCRLFCTPLWPKTPGPAWNIAAIFHTDWQYTTMDGQRLADTLSANHAIGATEQFVTLHITWTRGQWQVSFQNQGASSFDDPICITTIGEISTTPSYQQAPQAKMPLRWTYTSARNAAAGCLAVTQVMLATSSSWPQLGDALVLQRFGVLLAANDVAHQLWPNLPIADANAQQLAQMLLARIKW